MNRPNNFSLSFVTPTYNRAHLLNQQLYSLSTQIKSIDECIIIDNESTDTTTSVINKYKKKFPIHVYSAMKGTTYGALYNLGISKCTNDIVVFFDDDCVANKGFIEQIRLAHQRYPNSLIQGMTYSIPEGNIYAEIMGDHYQNWIKSNLQADQTHMNTFDNKNASIPKKLLDSKRLFNEKLRLGSEDIELGFRLKNEHIPIIFYPAIIAFHQERSTFKDFFVQHVRIARSESLINMYTKKDERIRLFPKRLSYHLQSAVLREKKLILTGRIIDAFLLPVLLFILLFSRIYGYTKK